MRSIINALLAVATCSVVAGEPAIDYSSLLKVPNLSPQLTGDEVSKEFTPWAERQRKIIAAGLKPDEAAVVTGARTALGSKLPQVTGITLFSLFPYDGPNIRQNESQWADELEKLPRFHDYPILGQLRIDDTAQANRWVDFLRDQILPGAFSSCEFRPRHGFRLSTSDGDIDILRCCSCKQLSYFGPSNLDFEHSPVFSSATKAQLNQLFDKLRIKRDEPPKNKG